MNKEVSHKMEVARVVPRKPDKSQKQGKIEWRGSRGGCYFLTCANSTKNSFHFVQIADCIVCSGLV